MSSSDPGFKAYPAYLEFHDHVLEEPKNPETNLSKVRVALTMQSCSRAPAGHPPTHAICRRSKGSAETYLQNGVSEQLWHVASDDGIVKGASFELHVLAGRYVQFPSEFQGIPGIPGVS